MRYFDSSAGSGRLNQRFPKQIVGKLFVHGQTKGKSYEHQNSYSDRDVLASLLYSIVQIAKMGKWE